MKSCTVPFLLLVSAVLSLAAACGDSGPRLSLLKSAPPPEDDDAELARLRQMEMVRVLDFLDPATGQLLDEPVQRELPPDKVADTIYEVCADELFGSATSRLPCFNNVPESNTNDPKNACFDAVCEASKELCAAQRLLDAAGVRAAPIRIEGQVPGEAPVNMVIPPQSTATNAALARLAARKHAARAMIMSFNGLRNAVGLSNIPGTPTSSRSFGIGQDHIVGQGCVPVDMAYRPTPTLLVPPPALGEPPLDPKNPNDITVGAILANRAVEAYHVFQEATLKAVDFTLAVADSQRANPSLQLQQSRSVAGLDLSRVEAAHLLVGGDRGLLGSTQSQPRPGLCSAPELSAQAQKAISVFRESGVSPKAILAIPGRPGMTSTGEITLDKLLNGIAVSVADGGVSDGGDGGGASGGADQVPDGSVRQRLAQRWGYDFDHPPAGINPNQSLLEYFHLKEEDFAQAREYLANEILAFSRPLDAQVDMTGLPAGVTPKYKLFVATAAPPTTLPATYYAAVARHAVSPPPSPYSEVFDQPLFDLSQQSTDADPAGSFRLSLAPGIDAALTQAGMILQNQAALSFSGFSTGFNAQMRADVMSALSTVLSAKERTGRVTICREDEGGMENVAWAANGFADTDWLRVVKGEDGLRCAVSGSLEGAKCADRLAGDFRFAGDLTLAFLFNSLEPPFKSFDKAAVGYFTIPIGSLDGTRLYLVRPRSPSPSDTSFVPLTGTDFTAGQRNSCWDIPIIPDVERRAAAIMAPSTKWCTSPNMNCAGTAFDARLPLDDELTKDTSGVESSWKHYLTLARQAARQADELGQQFLQSGLAIDEHQETIELRNEQKEELVEDRALHAIGELQETCGTAVDPVRLLHILSTGTDGTTLDLMRTDQHCGSPVDSACPSNFVCIAGACVADLNRLLASFQNDPIYSDLKRLADCINGDDVKDYVHLGSKKRPLCLWHEFNDKRRICEGADKDHPCPILSANGTCNNLNVPAGKVKVVVTESLAFLDTTDLPTPGLIKLSVCDRIRLLRANPRQGDDLNAIVRSNRFNWLKARQLANRIGFEAKYGGFASVRLNGAGIFTTGSPWDPPLVKVMPTDPSPPWPCGPAAVQGCPTSGPAPGLLCKVANCGDLDSRSDMNDRLARAVIAIAATQVGTTEHKGFSAWPVGVDNGIPVLDSFIWPVARTQRTSLNCDGQHLRVGLTLAEVQYCLQARGERLAFDGQTARELFVGSSRIPIIEYTSGWLVGPPSGEGDNPPPENLKSGLRIYEPSLNPDGVHAYRYRVRASENLKNYDTNVLASLSPGNDPGPWRVSLESYFPADLQQSLTPLDFYGGLSNDGTKKTYYWQALAGKLPPGTYVTQDAQNKTQGFPNSPPTSPGLGDLYFNYEPQALLDGLELLCEIEQPSDVCIPPPKVEKVADLPLVERFLECVGRKMEGAAASVVLANFPVAALDPQRRNSLLGSFPAIGGNVGVDISQLRSALQDVAEVPDLISHKISDMGTFIDDLHFAIISADVSKQLADVQLESAIANQVAGCNAASSPTVGLGGGAGGVGVSISQNLGFISICANSTSQITFARETNELNKKLADLGVQVALDKFTREFSDTTEALARYAQRLSQALDNADVQLQKFEQQKQAAQLALAKALYAKSFHSQAEDKVNAILLGRFQLDRRRYEEAFTTAQRMAFLAKRAIEMRLGVKLSEMTDDLPLVTAPASWESGICTSTGINFSDVDPNGTVALGQFTDPFIGDYVTKLENVVESYRLVHNFHEGSDTAVISLRDDVQNVRASCEVPVNNLLYNAGQLDRAGAGSKLGWSRTGCATRTVNGAAEPIPNCIGVLVQDELAFPGAPELSDAKAYKLQFGSGKPSCSGCVDMGNGTCDPVLSCGFQGGASLFQSVDVEAGRYRASVYLRDLETVSNPAAFKDAALQIKVGGTLVTPIEPQPPVPATPNSWPRLYKIFDVPTPQTISFGIGWPTSVSATGGNLVLAAPMLEKLPSADLETIGREPLPFANTTDKRTRKLPVCEDTDGAAFRAKGWTRGSALLCEDGFSGNCAGSTAKPFGYWETTFTINQRDIEAGQMLGNAGFARGNFNYRIDSIAVNCVGTGVHDCSSSPLPSTCNSAGFVPYTLIHNGPYLVRNHEGRDFEAHLFTGRIENARGLATERYITNPLSSTDQSLIKDYTRLELQGRPLDGNFVLRVWDAPGVNFDAIKDVQIVLNYRYWTRFQ